MSETKALIAHTYIGTLIQASQNEGIEVIASLEDDAFGSFTKTSELIQRHNWPDVNVIPYASKWPTRAQLPQDNNWYVIAHPPCAGGSMVTPSASRGGLSNPKSAFHVTDKFMKYAYDLNPPIIAVESVPGTLKYCGGDLKDMRNSYAPNYSIAFVLDVSNRYGCCSLRKRLWHIHYRNDLFPNGLNWERGAEAKRTLSEALAGASEQSNFIVSKQQQTLYTKFESLYQALPPGAYANNFLRKSGRWDLVPEGFPIKVKNNGEMFIFYESTANKRLAWDALAPTITGSTMLIHPDGTRPLTTREYLRVNGMPDTFEFPASMNNSKHITFIGKTTCLGITQWVIQNIKANLESL